MFELYEVGTFFVILLVLFIFVAFLARQKKSQAQETEISKPYFIDYSDSGSSGFYVATTYADRPLARISAHGLGYGGKAKLNVTARGVEVSRVGEESYLIPVDSFVGVAKTTAVIDRAVEKDGLVSLRWWLGETEVESFFRFPDSDQRVFVENALRELRGGSL